MLAESRTISTEERQNAERETRRLAKSHYENFLVASVLLPRWMRQPFYNVYAFCRTADDLADESGSPESALEKLSEFQIRLDQTFQGDPPDALFVALSGTIQAYRLPKQPFDDLLDAFRQDQRKTRYANFAELAHYCQRSANPVGRLVLQLADACTAENADLSGSICTGLQLANFWQDVARDYRIGRVYLPADEMERFGVKESMLENSTASPELKRLLASECDRAEALFHRGLPLCDSVPSWLANDIRLFAHGGLETLAAIRRIGFDVLAKRPTVSKSRQGWLVLRAMLRML
ncbi:MAG: squalene synthase HpnC [Planctomycetota bacterium]